MRQRFYNAKTKKKGFVKEKLIIRVKFKDLEKITEIF